jgi:hypothetical protein
MKRYHNYFPVFTTGFSDISSLFIIEYTLNVNVCSNYACAFELITNM